MSAEGTGYPFLLCPPHEVSGNPNPWAGWKPFGLNEQPHPGARTTLVQIGDTVNLVRKISNEILPMTLTQVLVKSKTPAVEVRWKTSVSHYKLDLVKNEVLAIDAKPSHRQSMRVWYTISEEHRKALTELFWDMRRKGPKR